MAEVKTARQADQRQVTAQAMLVDRVTIAPAVHYEPERFGDVAFAELSACPPWVAGVCFNPACQREFVKGRDWQIYCGAACRAQGDAEMRKWGHKVALPLLVDRLTKYDAPETPEGQLSSAARRYVSSVKTAWLHDRARRAGAVWGVS